MIVDRLGAKPVVLTLPIGSESGFKGLVDLITMKAHIWHNEDLGAKYDIVDIPDDMVEQAAEYRQKMLDSVVEADDIAMEAYLEGKEIGVDLIRTCVRKGTIASLFVPALCGSAFKNKGVQALLDAVVDYLPSPLDIGDIPCSDMDGNETSRKPDDNEPFCGLAFKNMNDPFVGSIMFVRIYSGVLKSGTSVLNSVKDKDERIGRMLLMHANNREDIKEAAAGDIVAVCALKHTATGETLCSQTKSVVLEKMEFPEPVIEIAIEPNTKADQEKMGIALSKLAAEDPSFKVASDSETGQTIIKGMGELHLEIKVDILKREYKVDAKVGAPQVAYRETITKQGEIDYTYKKQTGGAGQFAKMKLIFEPLEPGSGFEFDNKIVGGVIPKEYIPGVVKGLNSALGTGVIAGFPMIDFKATLVDGSYHDVDSSVLAFEIAARAAFREGIPKCAPRLLEPIMKVDVVTPEDYLGDIIGDLNSRRGQVSGMDQRGNAREISAMVPLANMFGYVNILRSMSQGRAQFSMSFDHYEQVPQQIADEIKNKMS
jgi:elongation factor G